MSQTTYNKKTRTARASQVQLTKMIDYFYLNKGLADGKFHAPHGKEESQKKWAELANELNSFQGATKTAEQWDFKSRTSIKAKDIRKATGLTGNKAISSPELVEFEQRVIGIIGAEYVEGNNTCADSIPEEELEPYMTESFIMNAFHKMGEQPQTVKVMRNRYTGEPAGYCFVHFPTDEMALDAMHKLNGKIIPGSNPAVRFRLNHASTTGKPAADREFSIWVGDLSTDVDDYSLYRAFAAKYNSIRTAKVILDSSGFSKGYGFVRFANEDEQKNSLVTMNGYRGLGTKSLKICNAVPRPWNKIPGSTPPQSLSDYSSSNMNSDAYNYYDTSTYWSSYSAWQQGYYESEPTSDTYNNYILDHKTEEDELELIEHSVPMDIDKLNRDVIEQDYNMWDALESSKWIPCDTLELCY